MSLWVQLIARPNCVIIDNLSWTSLLQYTTTNHTSGSILVFRNFPKHDFIGTVKDSWRCVVSSLLSIEWKWQFIYTIWTCSGFSIIFQNEIFHESPIIFQDESFIGMIRNSFPILYLYWLGCIHPSLLQDHFQGVYNIRFST